MFSKITTLLILSLTLVVPASADPVPQNQDALETLKQQTALLAKQARQATVAAKSQTAATQRQNDLLEEQVALTRAQHALLSQQIALAQTQQDKLDNHSRELKLIRIENEDLNENVLNQNHALEELKKKKDTTGLDWFDLFIIWSGMIGIETAVGKIKIGPMIILPKEILEKYLQQSEGPQASTTNRSGAKDLRDPAPASADPATSTARRAA